MNDLKLPLLIVLIFTALGIRAENGKNSATQLKTLRELNQEYDRD